HLGFAGVVGLAQGADFNEALGHHSAPPSSTHMVVPSCSMARLLLATRSPFTTPDFTITPASVSSPSSTAVSYATPPRTTNTTDFSPRLRIAPLGSSRG